MGFPDAQDPIEIGLKDTNTYFIPDPQPRQWSERQLSLERYLSRRPHVTEKEVQMRELARRATNAVEGCSIEDAPTAGVGTARRDTGLSELPRATAADIVPRGCRSGVQSRGLEMETDVRSSRASQGGYVEICLPLGRQHAAKNRRAA